MPPLCCEPGVGGGGISGGLLGTETSPPALARATGAEGPSAPPFAGKTAGPGRVGIGRPMGGAGVGTGLRAAPGDPPVALLITAGATGAGRSSGRSTEGTCLGAIGEVAGPAAGGGTRGLGGGVGGTTALRAVALMSAIERVSGWISDLKSCNFFRSSPAGTCGASTTGAGCTGAGAAFSTFSGSVAGSPPTRKCARTLSARSSSSALE